MQDILPLLKETFSLDELERIKQLTTDLHKMRKLDKSAIDKSFWKKKKSIQQQVEIIAEQEFYYIGDFIMSEGWANDRAKLETLWKYLQMELK